MLIVVICAAMSIISDQHSTSNNPIINKFMIDRGGILKLDIGAP